MNVKSNIIPGLFIPWNTSDQLSPVQAHIHLACIYLIEGENYFTEKDKVFTSNLGSCIRLQANIGNYLAKGSSLVHKVFIDPQELKADKETRWEFWEFKEPLKVRVRIFKVRKESPQPTAHQTNLTLCFLLKVTRTELTAKI